MKIKYLFPNKYKSIGWVVLIPSLILGLIITMFNIEPAFLDWRVPTIFMDEFMGEKKLLAMTENNVLNELVGVLIIVSGLLVAFSKEKIEDELISKIRLESLTMSLFISYGLVILSTFLIYNLSYMYVLVFNLFIILILFNLIFRYRLYEHYKS